MSKSSFRRRMMAALALAGIGGGAHAQVKDGPLSCNRSETIGPISYTYIGQFDVRTGRLVSVGAASGSASRNPTVSVLREPYTDTGFAIRAFVNSRPTDGSPLVAQHYELSGTISASDPRCNAMDGNVPVCPKTIDGRFTLEAYRGPTLLFSRLTNVQRVNNRPFAPVSYRLQESFATAKDLQQLRGPVQFVVKAQGSPVVRISTDLTGLDARPFIARQQAALGNAAFSASPRTPASCYLPGESNCFLTTAAVGTVGLADDCWELRTLRAFRDGALVRRPGGAALIEDYYRTAPQLVAAIGRRPDAARIWLRTYWTGIVPSALLARVGLHRAALSRYVAMTRRLERFAKG